MHIWKILLLMSFFYFGEIISSDDMSKHKLSGIIQWNFEKRPFCNAFTGCGRKRTLRSQARIETNNAANNEAAEALSDLIDINAEPAVENVQKQIMSQAKIYEAIKEASKEILIQKNKHKLSRGTN